MFSRSDKTDESHDEMTSFDAEGKQRSPMILAALAGVLAIAGAFLLVRYLSTTNDEAAEATAAAEASRQVLVVTTPIPAGTDVSDILAAPATWLSARAVPEQFVAASAVTSIEELRELDGLTLSSEALAGEQLLRGRFIDRSDFSGDGLIDRALSDTIRIPEGHHTVVVSLPSDQALGGNFGSGEKVSVISSFRVDPVDGDPFEVSVVVLPAVEVITVQTTADVVGQLATDSDSLGTATVGDVFVTLAVEPNELTDLTFAMKYGDIILAGALENATEDDLRPITTIETIIDGATFSNDEDLADLLGITAEDDEGLEPTDGEAGEDDTEAEDGDGDTDATDDSAPSDEVEDASAPAAGPAGIADNSADNAGPADVPSAPSASTSDEPEPAGPGETIDQQAPVDDSDGGNGALPPGN